MSNESLAEKFLKACSDMEKRRQKLAEVVAPQALAKSDLMVYVEAMAAANTYAIAIDLIENILNTAENNDEAVARRVLNRMTDVEIETCWEAICEGGLGDAAVINGVSAGRWIQMVYAAKSNVKTTNE